MRLVSGGENGQAFLWDLSSSGTNNQPQKVYEITSGASNAQTYPVGSHRESGSNGWTSMTWSSDGSCLASAREKSKGIVTLTHVKKVGDLR